MIINIKSLNSITCIDSCVGMCRRVLKDIHESKMSKAELIESYWNDKEHGGINFETIIELGELLKELKNNKQK